MELESRECGRWGGWSVMVTSRRFGSVRRGRWKDVGPLDSDIGRFLHGIVFP